MTGAPAFIPSRPCILVQLKDGRWKVAEPRRTSGLVSSAEGALNIAHRWGWKTSQIDVLPYDPSWRGRQLARRRAVIKAVAYFDDAGDGRDWGACSRCGNERWLFNTGRPDYRICGTCKRAITRGED
jgi:hypothetical protein